MSSLAFFDTNILLYADDHSAPKKQSPAVIRKLRVDPAVARRKAEVLPDALIVHARLANAAVLYSEDLGHGAVIGGIGVENPFLPPR